MLVIFVQPDKKSKLKEKGKKKNLHVGKENGKNNKILPRNKE